MALRFERVGTMSRWAWPYRFVMQVTRQDLNPCTVELTIALEPEAVKQGYEAALKQLTKKVKLPGFRPGKAPRSMLLDLVSEAEWNEAAAEEIVRRAYPKAIQQEGLEPDVTTSPNVAVKLLDRETGVAEFQAKVPLAPKVELGDYKNLPLEQPKSDVTEEEVEFQVEELRKKGQTRVAVTDRGIIEGDVAVVNIKADGATDGRNFMTVAGQTFPQLDEAIRGLKVEEMKSLDLTFPDNFQDKEWAGKTIHATVTINSLTSVQLPSLDDSFAQSLKTESLEDLKNRIREGIGRAKQSMIRQILHERLLEALHARSMVHVSDNMWENLADRRLRETAEEQARNQKTLEQYAAENGMTLDQLVEAWRVRAKTEVERALLIQQVYSKEELKITNLDLNEELVAMAQEYGIKPEELLQLLQQNKAFDELQFRTLARKVGDFLLKHADVTVVELGAESKAATAEAKPAKAPAKKKAAEAAEAAQEEAPAAKKKAAPKAAETADEAPKKKAPAKKKAE